FEGKRREVFIRVGKSENTVFIDLGESNRVAEVDEKGWRVSDISRCLFYRPTGLKALPEPVRTSASLESLIKPLVNVRTESDFRLLIGWIVSAFRVTGPYPILILHGEQGGAKSSLCGMLRALIDPNTAPLRGQPRCEDDFVLQAKNSWLVALDNLSAV